MKNEFVMILIAITLITTACGSTDGDVTQSVSETLNAGEKAPAGTQADTQSESAAAAETAGESGDPEVGYYPGTYTDTGYESDYLGYQFTTPEGYTLSTQEELATMIGMSIESLSDDLTEAEAAYAQQAIIYDMMAIADNETNVPNVTISLQQYDTAGITLETIVEAMMLQLSRVTAMKVDFIGSYELVTFAGKEYYKANAKVDSAGVEYMLEYYFGMTSDRIIYITFTYFEDSASEKEELAAAFAGY